MTKISERKFWNLMYKHRGIYWRVVKAIRGDKDIENMSRQAVQQRAKRKPERLEDCKEAAYDAAEEVVHNLMENSANDRVKLDAAREVLRGPGKHRGYTTKQEVEHSGHVDISQKTQYSVKKRPNIAS